MNLKETGNPASQGLPYNVHMVMIDAQSLSNMHRQTPKLMAILEQDENAMLFKAHGIHGDGTTCQLLATLAGEFRNKNVRNVPYLTLSLPGLIFFLFAKYRGFSDFLNLFSMPILKSGL